MNKTSKLYIPNAALWINFFKKKKRETVNQSGGGPKIVPINEISTDSVDYTASKPVKIDLVSPVEAATNRAEQEVKRRKRVRKVTFKQKRKARNIKRKRKAHKNQINRKPKRVNKKKKKKINQRTRDIFD